ncbi:hypothetical protein Q5X44_17920 [Acinetobacter baumannii]|nr:hypothetical protein [Acinetobacter baumannii]
MDKCREEFEVVARKNGWNLTTYPEITGRIDYVNVLTEQAWQMFQHQQAKVEELQEEFAEDERFLKEQIKDKDLKISNLEYQQGMDKELIQTLQCKVEKLQKRVNSLEKAEFKLAQVKAILQNNPKLLESILVKKIEQALKGECKHESDGTNRLSLPPKTRCWKCGEFYSAHELKEGDQ